ncbi:hypothetical protein AB0J21_30030 [Streptomyces sp. NPDC049954]
MSGAALPTGSQRLPVVVRQAAGPVVVRQNVEVLGLNIEARGKREPPYE